MRRRRFDHLVTELSVEVGAPVPRFALWHALHEQGHDPERLSRDAVLAFCDGPLQRFLGGLGLVLPHARTRRLRRRVARFDPRYPAPEEVFARF